MVYPWSGHVRRRPCDFVSALRRNAGTRAERFAAKQPDVLNALVLVDSLGLAPFQPMPEFAAALTEFVRAPDEQTHDRLWQLCASDLESMRDRIGERWKWLKAYNVDRARTASVQAAVGALLEHFAFKQISAAELDRITVPTTLIWGRHDPATNLAVAAATSKKYGWPLHVIEDAGDDPPIEQPAAFVATLRGVLRASQPTTAR